MRSVLMVMVLGRVASAGAIGGDDVFAAHASLEPNAGLAAWFGQTLGDHLFVGGDFAIETATRGSHGMATSLQPIVGVRVPLGVAMLVADFGIGGSLQFDPITLGKATTTDLVASGSARALALFDVGRWSALRADVYLGGGVQARAPLTFDSGGAAYTISIALMQ